MTSVREMREALVAVSRRYSRVEHEAEDLAHDIIVSALRRGVPPDGEMFARSARRAAQLHGAFLARSAGRRRARENRAAAAYIDHASGETGSGVVADPQPSTLSPALETTLLLLALGLVKAELRAALGVSDAALRKRFQALREQRPRARPTVAVANQGPAPGQLRRSQVKLLPQLAVRLARDQRARRVLAAADPDGHGLILVETLTTERSTATTSTRVPDAGWRTEGRPCSTASYKTSPSYLS